MLVGDRRKIRERGVGWYLILIALLMGFCLFNAVSTLNMYSLCIGRVVLFRIHHVLILLSVIPRMLPP